MPLLARKRFLNLNHAGVYAPAPGGGSTLYTGLTSFWELSESSGTRADSTASANTLTDNNTVTGGNDGVAYSEFTSANTEYLSHTDNASLSLGNISFSVNVWAYEATSGSYLIGKAGGFGQAEWQITRTFSGGQVYKFTIFNSAHDTDEVIVAAPSTDAWHMITVICTLGGNISIAVDNGTPATTAKTRTINDSTSDFTIGGNTSSGNYWNGRIRRAGFWKKALTGTEVTQLYNSGAGLSYAAMA
jgi:hypothetical protein